MASEQEMMADLATADASGDTQLAQHIADQIKAARAPTSQGGKLMDAVRWLGDKQAQSTRRMSDSLNKLTGGDPEDTYRAVNMAIGMGGIPASTEVASSLAVRAPRQMSEALTSAQARLLYGKQAADPQQGLRVPIASDLTPSAALEMEGKAITPGPATPQNATANARPPAPQPQAPYVAGESFGAGPSRPQRGASAAKLAYRAKFLPEAAAEEPAVQRIGASDLSTPTLRKLKGLVETPAEAVPDPAPAATTEAEREALRQRWREMSGSRMAPIGEPAAAPAPAETLDQWPRQPAQPNALYRLGARLRDYQAKPFDPLDLIAGAAGYGHGGNMLEAAAMSAGSRLLRSYGPKALGATMQGVSKIPAEVGKQSLTALLRELAIRRSEATNGP